MVPTWKTLFNLLLCFAVVRSKKRAVSVATSLRSNKKVSSLVDKVALYDEPPITVSKHHICSQHV